MVGWHHWLDGHELEHALGDSGGQRSLVCYSPWGGKKLEKTLESPSDRKEIHPVHPKGDQSWVFIRRTDVEAETPIVWPPDGKN